MNIKDVNILKHLNKIWAILLSVVLLASFAACDKKDNDTKVENSKPTVSTPSKDDTTTESKPEETKPEESKPEESKPQTSTPSKPAVTQKPASTLILGKWKTKVDACEILLEYEIELEGPIYIDVMTIFGNDLSYSVDIEPPKATEILKAALPDYDEGFIDDCVGTLSDALFESGVYKFEGEKFKIMLDGDPDYTEIDYAFKNSNNKLTISFPSDERDYERVS